MKRTQTNKREKAEEPLRPLAPGTVTKVSPQKHDHQRVSVYLDGEFAFGLLCDLAVKYRIHPGKELNIDEQQELLEQDRFVRAKLAALEYIAYKPRTEGEVRQKLRSRRFQEETIDSVLERFRELGYLDDETYARSFAKSRLRSKGYGPRRIEQDLRKRGVDRTTIAHTLQELEETENPLEAALQQAEKRWKRLQSENDPRKRKKKLMDFLLRRGFSYDIVKKATQQTIAEN